jgi:hypothetical protein
MNDYASAAAPKKDNQKMFYILLTFALLGSWGYIFYDQAQSKKIQADLQTKIAKIDSAKTEDEIELAVSKMTTTLNQVLGALTVIREICSNTSCTILGF